MNRRFVIAVTAVTAVLVVAIVVLVSGDGGGSPGGSSQPAAADIGELVGALPPTSGDTDRDQMRSLIGRPDAFTVSLEQLDDGSVVRREEWFYYELRSAYEFVDGAFVSNLPLEQGDELVILPIQYDPADFQLGVTWETVVAGLSDTSDFESYELEDEYGVNATYYVGDQLLLLFDEDGLLFYVEAIPLETGADES